MVSPVREKLSLDDAVGQFYTTTIIDEKGEEENLHSIIGKIYKKNISILGVGLKYYISGDEVAVFSFDIWRDMILKTRPSVYLLADSLPSSKITCTEKKVSKSTSFLPEFTFKYTLREEVAPNSKELGVGMKSTRDSHNFSEINGSSLMKSDSSSSDKKGKKIKRLSKEIRTGNRGTTSSMPQLGSFRYRKESLEVELKNIEEAKKMCAEHKFTKVIIPETIFRKIFADDEEEYDVLFKKKIHFDSFVKEDSILCSDNTLKELVKFILFFNYSDCYPRNLKPINEGDAIAIIDFGPDSRNGWEFGLFGFAPVGTVGLWDFVPESQHKIIIDLIKKHGFDKDFIPKNRGLKIFLDQTLTF